MTSIEWTTETWNPMAGCSIVSPGCTHCYAMSQAYRLLDKPGSHYEGTTTKAANGRPVWTGKVALAPDHILTKPLRVKKPTTWFVNSMSDLFHDDVPVEWIDRVFAVMALSPHHTFQVLTKRSVRMRQYLSSASSPIRVLDAVLDVADAAASVAHQSGHARPWEARPKKVAFIDDPDAHWPLTNVWLGVSAERQKEAEARIPDLIETPAAVRFVSAEPLLGGIDFTALNWIGGRRLDVLHSYTSVPMIEPGMWAHAPNGKPALDWIIVGGESGAYARPMNVAHLAAIVAQCKSAGVPVFVKQMGANPQEDLGARAPTRIRYRSPKGGDPAEWPAELRVRQMPGEVAP